MRGENDSKFADHTFIHHTNLIHQRDLNVAILPAITSLIEY